MALIPGFKSALERRLEKLDDPVKKPTRQKETKSYIDEALEAGQRAVTGSTPGAVSPARFPLGGVQEAAHKPYQEGGFGGGLYKGGEGSEEEAKQWIISKESGGNPAAKNPKSSAFGLGQLIQANREAYASKLGVDPWTTNPDAQSKMMDMYVNDRYGSYQNARKFWEQHGWY